MHISEQQSTPLLVDDIFLGYTAQCIGDYHNPLTVTPALNQPVFHALTEGFGHCLSGYLIDTNRDVMGHSWIYGIKFTNLI